MVNSFSPEKEITTKSIYGNNTDSDKAVVSILDQVGLIKNFEVLESSAVDNAAAVVYNNERYILYNHNFMEIANRISNNSWASISILAHEIGHHLQGHTLDNKGSRPPLELEADKFSGFVLAKMGASLEDAQSAILNLVSEKPSDTHPSRSKRLKAIASGFADGTKKKNSLNINDVQVKSSNKNNAVGFYDLSKTSKIDYVIQNKIGSNWRLEELGDFINDSYDLQIIREVRKKDNNFPFTAFGDFDDDGSQDIALKIVNNGVSKLVIYNPNIDKIYWWNDNVKGSVIKRVNSSEIESYNGDKAFNMSTDGIMVEYLESSLYYIFWNGNEFSKIWLSD
jgi:hypothetical protein